ncbi:MAG: tyrosine decarboxylase MfnA [Promethearchaeota archaeon]
MKMMEEHGVSEDMIYQILEQRLNKDLKYETGKILGSMCTKPHDFALEVFKKYAYKNLGDPGLFPGTLEIEQELIRDIGELLHGKNIKGTMVSGGSEANLIGIYIAKLTHPKIKKPELVCSSNAHMSIFKAAKLMGIRVKKVELDENFLPKMDVYKSKINKNTICVLGIAGTTSLGVVEPIDEIGELIEGRDIHFHVDAAFGGFTLPFLEDLGYKFPKYDFRVEQVDTITADPHKMGMAVIPSGGILIRDFSILEEHGFTIPYLAGGAFKHLTITGTRPGASAISFWALMKKLGRSGFRNVVKECWENAQYLAKQIHNIHGIDIVTPIQMNIVGIKNTTKISQSICLVENELRKRGWALGVFRKFNLARVVCMPHIKRIHIDMLIDDLKDIIKELEKKYLKKSLN